MYICTHRYSVNPILHRSIAAIKISYFDLSNVAFSTF